MILLKISIAVCCCLSTLRAMGADFFLREGAPGGGACYGQAHKGTKNGQKPTLGGVSTQGVPAMGTPLVKKN